VKSASSAPNEDSISQTTSLIGAEVVASSTDEEPVTWRNPETLSTRCPLCFGKNAKGDKPKSAVVILDGNFQQKRLGGRPSILHRNKIPDNRLFVSPNTAEKYENGVTDLY